MSLASKVRPDFCFVSDLTKERSVNSVLYATTLYNSYQQMKPHFEYRKEKQRKEKERARKLGGDIYDCSLNRVKEKKSEIISVFV